MYIVFIVLIIIASSLLILAVLAQSPKGGMAANFGASNQVMGVRQTADFLEKFTWGLALVIVVFAVGSTMAIPTPETTKSIDQKVIENVNKESGVKQFETPTTTAPASETPAQVPVEPAK